MLDTNALQKLRNTLLPFIDSTSVFAVACSGGIDSIFLVKFLSQSTSNIRAIIIDHKLEKSSTENANKTQATLKQWGIISDIITWEHGDINTGIEEKARIARYQLITDFCHHNNIKHVLLAHHIDDRIETFMMNSMRGVGLQGITSMRKHSVINGINFHRPMIDVIDKTLIKNYVQKNEIPWFEDKTNTDIKFTRNRVRQFLNLSFTEKLGIIKTINTLDTTYSEILQKVSQIIKYGQFKNHILSIETYTIRNLLLHEFVIFINEAVRKIFPFKLHEIRQNSLKNLYHWILDSNDGGKTISQCLIIKKDNKVSILPEYQRLNSFEINNTNNTLNWNNMLYITSNQECNIVPLGLIEENIRKKYNIKKAFLEIAHLPVFVYNTNILAIPHLNILNKMDLNINYENHS